MRLVSLTALAVLAACSNGKFEDTAVKHTSEPTDTTSTSPTDPGPAAPVSGAELRISDVQSTVPILDFTLDEAVDSVWLEFSFDDGDWLQSPVRDGAAGEHSEFLFGVPEDLVVTVRVMVSVDGATLASADEWQIRNGRAPDLLPRPDDVFLDEDLVHDSRWVLGSLNWKDGGWTSGDYFVFIMDRKGRYVWARLTPDQHWALYPRVSKQGTHLMLDESTYWSDHFDASGSLLHRVTLDGTIWETIEMPGLHHAWVERDDGTLIWGSVLGWDGETLDYREPGGDIQTLWSSDVWQNMNGVSSYFESNTVNWDPATDIVQFSFYTNDSVVEVQYPTGETVHVWGELPGSYAFNPPESQFQWQHGVHRTTDGTLLLSTHLYTGPNEQRAREYIIDDENQELVEIWKYGEGTGKYAPTAGECYRLDNGNYLINYGGIAGIREITADSVTAWDIIWDGSKLIGHTTLIDDLYALNEGPE